MIDVIEILKRLEAEKRDNHIVPCIINFIDIQNAVNEQVKAELNTAVQDGAVEFHRTINGTAFNIKV